MQLKAARFIAGLLAFFGWGTVHMEGNFLAVFDSQNQNARCFFEEVRDIPKQFLAFTHLIHSRTLKLISWAVSAALSSSQPTISMVMAFLPSSGTTSHLSPTFRANVLTSAGKKPSPVW